MSEETNDQIRALQEKSEQALSDAELLLENGSVEAAINRGYYAVFQIARAALLTKEESPDTHSGVIRRFGYHFVRTGQVPEEVGDTLTTAQSMRGGLTTMPLPILTKRMRQISSRTPASSLRFSESKCCAVANRA